MIIKELKTIKERPHHYIIGVAIHPALSEKAGQLYLKYGPIYFRNIDIEKLRDAIAISSDQLIKTSIEDALNIYDVPTEIFNSIKGFLIATNINMATKHHFSSKYKMLDEDFIAIVHNANHNKSFKELLNESRF